jgi:hypothetical protein
MVAYVPGELAKAADALRLRASRLIYTDAILGAAISLVLVPFVPVGVLRFALIGAGLVVGAIIGEERAAALRLRAEIVCCLVAIEAKVIAPK